MADDSAPAVDLLGDPWTPPRDPRGRKRHRGFPQIAETVAVLRATGMGVEDIAGRIGLSAPTLRKYYFRELDQGHSLAKAVLTEAIWKSALEGKTSSQRLAMQLIEQGDAAVPMARGKAPGDREEPMGKKAQADFDALDAHQGTSWAELLPH